MNTNNKIAYHIGDSLKMDPSIINKFLTKEIHLIDKRESYHDESAFRVANCYVQLGRYTEAQKLYAISCAAMLEPPKFWKQTAQPFWLIDIGVLGKRTDLYPKIMSELEQYKKDPLGDSPGALYSFAMMELLLLTGNDITKYIKLLLKYPKIKIGLAWGQAIQAITTKDDLVLNSALSDLLKVHAGMAKHGGLRVTAEGLLCMSAMSIAHVALKNKLEIKIKNEYLSMGYLEFLNS